VNKNTKTLLKSILHRLDNLRIFFFESPEANEKLWFKQQNEYVSAANAGKVIPLGSYPRDSDYANDYIPHT